MEKEKILLRMEDEPALDRIRCALTRSGLKVDNLEEVLILGFENPEKGYAVWVGGVLPGFEREYDQIKEGIPTSYSLSRFPNSGLSDRIHCPIGEEKRDILARRVMVKRAIISLDTKIEEQREEPEGGNYIIDSYYKVCVEKTKIGLFIKNPKGSRFSAGF